MKFIKLEWWRRLWVKFHQRFIERHHLIKIGPPGYYHADERMIRALFAILVEFIEKYEPRKQIDWGVDEVTRLAWTELMELYKWWKEERPKRLDPIRGMKYEDVPPVEDLGKSGKYPVWEEARKLAHDLRKQWDEEDERQMFRLIGVRGYMWT